jgi:hypothetical protein
MSAFTPLRSLPNNPITTQEHHSEQTSSVVFDPRRQGIHIIRPIPTGSVPISNATHFTPIQTNNVQYSSPDMFEPPAIRRTKRGAPMMPNL